MALQGAVIFRATRSAERTQPGAERTQCRGRSPDRDGGNNHAERTRRAAPTAPPCRCAAPRFMKMGMGEAGGVSERPNARTGPTTAAPSGPPAVAPSEPNVEAQVPCPTAEMATPTEPNAAVEIAVGGRGLVVEAPELGPSPRGLDDELTTTRPVSAERTQRQGGSPVRGEGNGRAERTQRRGGSPLLDGGNGRPERTQRAAPSEAKCANRTIMPLCGAIEPYRVEDLGRLGAVEPAHLRDHHVEQPDVGPPSCRSSSRP